MVGGDNFNNKGCSAGAAEKETLILRQQTAAFFEEAILDADGTIAETTGECKEGMDIAHNGKWGYAPLVISLAQTKEVLYTVNRRVVCNAAFRRPT